MRPIDYVCFHNRSGYAQAAQDYIYALKQSGQFQIHISLLHSTPDTISITPERYRETMEMLKTEVPPEAVQILHCIPEMQRRARKAKAGIGFATFETYDPPKHWIDILNTNEAVICPSKFNVDVFRRAGVKVPIHHIPHVVDTKLYHPSVQPDSKDERFTFLYFGTWKRRKGWRELVEAYLREFTPADNVRLLVKTDRLSVANRDIGQIRENLGLTEKDSPPISFETRILNEVDLPRFLKSADCLVSPTYGEGFGLPGLQCMALGIPVIITDFSGCTDYANEETATLLKPAGFILYNEMDSIAQFRNKKWAHVSVTAVQSAMRDAVNNTDKVRAKAGRAAEFAATNFSYKVAAQRFNELMDTI